MEADDLIHHLRGRNVGGSMELPSGAEISAPPTTAVSLRASPAVSDATLLVLKHSYRFVAHDWQHASRELLQDEGFEDRFRELAVLRLSSQGWRVSQRREMHLGQGIDTASGTLHEIDLTTLADGAMTVFELKHRFGALPDKNDVIVFFAKLLDFLAFNPSLLLHEVCPVFMSASGFETSGLAACLGLGIHPVAPDLRPFPVLVDSARRIEAEINRRSDLPRSAVEAVSDFVAGVNRMGLALDPTWLAGRCGFRSENTIVLKASGGYDVLAMEQEFRTLNGECTRVLSDLRASAGGN